MRIGTRTLKVTAWLSAAVVGCVAACAVASFWGSVLIIKRPNWTSEISRGELLLVRGPTFPSRFVTSDPDGVQLFQPGRFVYPWGSYLIPRWQLSRRGLMPVAVVLPLWLPALVSLAVGVPAFVTLRRRARAIKNGACPKCGYMLTGLPPAAPRHECGRAA